MNNNAHFLSRENDALRRKPSLPSEKSPYYVNPWPFAGDTGIIKLRINSYPAWLLKEWKMLLAKGCESKYNIKNGTLKLGTLVDYRTTENLEILDREEGMLKFLLNIEGEVVVDAKLYNTFAGGSHHIANAGAYDFPGITEARFISGSIHTTNNREVLLRDCVSMISRESLNCFVFCMSRVRRTQDAAGIFKGYDDCWYLPEAKALEFGYKIGQLLQRHIQSEQAAGRHILPAGTDMNSVKLFCQHRIVKYIARDIHINTGDPLVWNGLIERLKDMSFTKPDNFAHELEYRFTYTALSNKHVIEPIVKQVFLNSEDLLDIIIQI